MTSPTSPPSSSPRCARTSSPSRAEPSPRNPDIEVRDVEVISDGWGVLRLTTFAQRRRDGTSKTLKRESYDRGDSSAILLYNLDARTVLLTRQFRYPAYEHGHEDGMLVEAAAGSVEPGEDPAETIRRETSEELGVEIGAPEHLFAAYLSPGALTEHQDFYAAAYTSTARTGPGGGLAEEGEDIEVLELPFNDALAMIGDGRVVDAKTIILLQWAALSGPFAVNRAA